MISSSKMGNESCILGQVQALSAASAASDWHPAALLAGFGSCKLAGYYATLAPCRAQYLYVKRSHRKLSTYSMCCDPHAHAGVL
jgi:hypothetical protein